MKRVWDEVDDRWPDRLSEVARFIPRGSVWISAPARRGCAAT